MKKRERVYDIPPVKAAKLRKETRNFANGPPLAVTASPVVKHGRKDYEGLLLETVEKIEPGCELDPIARAYGLLQAMKQMVKSLDELVDEAVADKIRADGPFVLGDEKFYVGNKTTVKCRDVYDTYKQLMSITGGDEKAVIACLSVNAWKHGSVRSLLAETFSHEPITGEVFYNNLFETTNCEEVKTGKPTKKDGSLQRLPLTILKRLQS